MLKRLEVDDIVRCGVIYPDGDSGPYKCGIGITLLSTMWTNFGLLSYAYDKEMQVNVQTRIVYQWNWLKWNIHPGKQMTQPKY